MYQVFPIDPATFFLSFSIILLIYVIIKIRHRLHEIFEGSDGRLSAMRIAMFFILLIANWVIIYEVTHRVEFMNDKLVQTAVDTGLIAILLATAITGKVGQKFIENKDLGEPQKPEKEDPPGQQ